jgi:hypothetical protein
MQNRILKLLKDNLAGPYAEAAKFAKANVVDPFNTFKTDAKDKIMGNLPDPVYHFYVQHQDKLTQENLNMALSIANFGLAALVFRGMFVNAEVSLEELLDIAVHLVQGSVNYIDSDALQTYASALNVARIINITEHTLSWNSSIPFLTNMIDIGLHSTNLYTNSVNQAAAKQKKNGLFPTSAVATVTESKEVDLEEVKEEGLTQRRKIM